MQLEKKFYLSIKEKLVTDIKKMEFSDETGEVNIERSNGTTVKYNMADVVTASTSSSGEIENTSGGWE